MSTVTRQEKEQDLAATGEHHHRFWQRVVQSVQLDGGRTPKSSAWLLFIYLFFSWLKALFTTNPRDLREQTASVDQKCIFGKLNICTEKFAQLYSEELLKAFLTVLHILKQQTKMSLPDTEIARINALRNVILTQREPKRQAT